MDQEESCRASSSEQRRSRRNGPRPEVTEARPVPSAVSLTCFIPKTATAEERMKLDAGSTPSNEATK